MLHQLHTSVEHADSFSEKHVFMACTTFSVMHHAGLLWALQAKY